MVNTVVFFEKLQSYGVNFFSGVPDSLLKNCCSYLTDNMTKKQHIIAANEGNAIGLGIGYHLSTNKTPLVYLQNSGLGNIINPLLSLADQEIYSIPMLLLIGWRGEPGTKDEPQHIKQGKVTLPLLESMEIPYKILSPEMGIEDMDKIVNKAISTIRKSSSPFAFVVRKNTFEDYRKQAIEEESQLCSREEAVIEVLKSLQPSDIVVSTTGMASREVFEYRHRNAEGHEKDFLTVGGMGHANQIAVGIALQKPKRQVLCLDGDGAALMHMGSLCINGNLPCSNFKHIILNNAAHDSVGGQPTVGNRINLVNIAKSAGYLFAETISCASSLNDAVKKMRETSGPCLLEICVKKGARSDIGRPTIAPVDNKKNFMEFILND